MSIYSAEFSKVLTDIYQKASENPQFRQRLLADGNGVLKEHGFDLPAGLTVKFSEDMTVSVPLPPAFALSEEDLESVAGGVSTNVAPSAQDEVSSAIAALFGSHGAQYQALASQASAAHDRFRQS
jgi:hypothetical protein